MRHKQRQPDPNRRHERPPMLLGREHEDGKDELGGEEHLDEEALRYGGAAAEGGADGEGAGEKGGDDGGGGDAAEELGRAEEEGARGGEGRGEVEGECYLVCLGEYGGWKGGGFGVRWVCVWGKDGKRRIRREGETNSRIKQATTDPEEDPRVHG